MWFSEKIDIGLVDLSNMVFFLVLKLVVLNEIGILRVEVFVDMDFFLLNGRECKFLEEDCSFMLLGFRVVMWIFVDLLFVILDCKFEIVFMKRSKNFFL